MNEAGNFSGKFSDTLRSVSGVFRFCFVYFVVIGFGFISLHIDIMMVLCLAPFLGNAFTIFMNMHGFLWQKYFFLLLKDAKVKS